MSTIDITEISNLHNMLDELTQDIQDKGISTTELKLANISIIKEVLYTQYLKSRKTL